MIQKIHRKPIKKKYLSRWIEMVKRKRKLRRLVKAPSPQPAIIAKM